MRELIVDNFAGGGGASTGIELALGRSPDFAINHDREALQMHEANHPETVHLCEDVWDVDPREACAGKPVGLAWFSPDCTFHSKARGGKPFRDRNKARRRRGLAWLVVKWAKAVRPRVILLENVEEFEQWGPLDDQGKPLAEKRGFTFRRWLSRLKNSGYDVDCRQLRACDYGAPTSRKRLFVIARCDGLPIVWPQPTHGKGRAHPWSTAAECIDWTIPCPSIFDRKKPLAENTLRRIARGIRRYVIEAAEPFIVRTAHGEQDRSGKKRGRGEHSLGEPLPTQQCTNDFALVAPSLIQTSYGERKGQAPRVLDLHQPLGTVVGGGVKHSLVSAFLARHYGGHENAGASAQLPLPTITAKDHHAVISSHLLKLHGSSQIGQSLEGPAPTIRAQGTHLAEVRAFLLSYYGTEQDPQLGLPMATVTTKDRFGLVTIHGHDYVIADIGMRMLTPRELFLAQGFPAAYEIEKVAPYRVVPSHGLDVGKGPLRTTLSKTAQVRMCGNSVCPPLAAALVRANCGDLAMREVA